MHHLLLTTLLAATPPAMPVETEEAAPVESPELRAWSDRLQVAMRDSASARERALVSMFYTTGPLEERDRLDRARRLEAAARAAPADGLVQFTWTMNLYNDPRCAAATSCLEQRMAASRAEPDNGMAWMLAMRSGLPEKETTALIDRAAQAECFDDHYVDAVGSWTQALAARPMSASLAKEMFRQSGEPALAGEHDANLATRMMGFAFSFPYTFYGWGAYSACDRARLPQAPEARFESCARLGRKILHSGTTDMLVNTGIAIVKSTGLATPEDMDFVRRHRWKREQLALSGGPSATAAEFNLYFDDLLSMGSEIRAQESMLQRKGLALDPPEAWKPEHE